MKQMYPLKNTNPSLLIDDLIENFSRADVKIKTVGEIPKYHLN